MYTSAAKVLTEIGIEIELLRGLKKENQKLSIYCSIPNGLLKIYHLRAASEELITLIGLDSKGVETHFCVTSSAIQVAMRLEPKEAGDKERPIVVDGFTPK